MSTPSWMTTGFTKRDAPIIGPDPSLRFRCPVSGNEVRWAEKDLFNPAAAVNDGQVYLLIRAEDTVAHCKGTSRLGLAVSRDGVDFTVDPEPVLFPDRDRFLPWERDGGCEDPRLILRDDGTWICTYTGFNGMIAVLCVATSRDLRRWTKHGPAFTGTPYMNHWSKSGAIVGRWRGDQLVAERIGGTYWMYWGEGVLYAATSDDGVAWTPVTERVDRHRMAGIDGFGAWVGLTPPHGSTALKPVLYPRAGAFDRTLVEPGPAAVLGDQGIVLWYNGVCPVGEANAYSGGQALFDGVDPTVVIERPREPFIVPDQEWELTGQVAAVAFIEGLVRFRGKHHLYYGCADSRIGLAVS